MNSRDVMMSRRPHGDVIELGRQPATGTVVVELTPGASAVIDLVDGRVTSLVLDSVGDPLAHARVVRRIFGNEAAHWVEQRASEGGSAPYEEPSEMASRTVDAAVRLALAVELVRRLPMPAQARAWLAVEAVEVAFRTDLLLPLKSTVAAACDMVLSLPLDSLLRGVTRALAFRARELLLAMDERIDLLGYSRPGWATRFVGLQDKLDRTTDLDADIRRLIEVETRATRTLDAPDDRLFDDLRPLIVRGGTRGIAAEIERYEVPIDPSLVDTRTVDGVGVMAVEVRRPTTIIATVPLTRWPDAASLDQHEVHLFRPRLAGGTQTMATMPLVLRDRSSEPGIQGEPQAVAALSHDRLPPKISFDIRHKEVIADDPEERAARRGAWAVQLMDHERAKGNHAEADRISRRADISLPATDADRDREPFFFERLMASWTR